MRGRGAFVLLRVCCSVLEESEGGEFMSVKSMTSSTGGAAIAALWSLHLDNCIHLLQDFHCLPVRGLSTTSLPPLLYKSSSPPAAAASTDRFFRLSSASRVVYAADIDDHIPFLSSLNILLLHTSYFPSSVPPVWLQNLLIPSSPPSLAECLATASPHQIAFSFSRDR